MISALILGAVVGLLVAIRWLLRLAAALPSTPLADSVQSTTTEDADHD